MNFIGLTTLLIIATSTVVRAQESLPAVSNVNGKVDYQGGWLESEEGHNIGGSISLPIGTKFGLQADGLFTHVSDREYFTGAGHLFWRNPEIGLVGITGGGIYSDGSGLKLGSNSRLDGYQAAIEGEYYFDSWTVRAVTGVGGISYDSSVTWFDTDPTMLVGTLFIDWYAMDNLRVAGGYSFLFENHLAHAEIEYQTPWKGLTFTADFARGENDYDHALFGVRFYFGQEKSLKDRHRQDDPRSFAQNILMGVGFYSAEFDNTQDDVVTNVNDKRLRRPPTDKVPFIPSSPPQ